ncbi:uncharacterized protein LOC122654734 [Telopea speciosissima]|uniref:uncharacterized protein LOC122654734 n=1 Tax=Telopea speciosissima TaxID=54955 RepID=UPI001CC80616|nr:uncharacterized protein LOC122654734 [Telopea speciosissima]
MKGEVWGLMGLREISLLITATSFLFLLLPSYGVEGEMATLSREEDLELDIQLKLLNKPAMKSIQTVHGEIFDCVHINKQPAFDHPLLKNHTIQMRPSLFPKGMIHGASLSRVRHPQIKLHSGGCPRGTVPIKRTTKEDLIRARMISMKTSTSSSQLHSLNYPGYHRAGITTTGDNVYYGAKAHIIVYNPPVSGLQYSQALMWIYNDAPNHDNCIQVGWMVDPLIFGDKATRMYARWTVQGSGCWNTFCPGFVQVNPVTPVGSIIDPVSTYNGSQYEIIPIVFQDRLTGNWWLSYNARNIVGYWPKALFNSLDSFATGIAWGGSTYKPMNEPNSPPMGSGHFPDEGFGRASFMGGIQVVDENGSFVALNESIIANYTDKTNCYKVGLNSMDQFGSYSFYYGGPGGYCGY